MDFRAFDRARRQVGPLELDLVETYAKGAMPRREFVRRGTILGLSIPFLSAVVAACGSDSGSSSGTTAGTGAGTQPSGTGGGTDTPGGSIKVASQVPAAFSDSPAECTSGNVTTSCVLET